MGFVFTVTSDDHDNRNTQSSNAMTNIMNESSELHFDLGDTFYTDGRTSQSQVNSDYLSYRTSGMFKTIASSVPVFVAVGNHENEEGWNLNDTPFSIALGSIQARKAFFPLPHHRWLLHRQHRSPSRHRRNHLWG